MSVSLANGDLIKMAKENEFDLIGHFCDCEKRWDSSLSVNIKEKYPLSYNVDSDSFPMDLGEYSICDDYLFKIANIYLFCIDQNIKETVYKALNQVCFNIDRKYSGSKVGFSYDQLIEIGLEWEQSKKIFISNFKSAHLTIVKN